jgi:hypothetical protein
MLISFRWPVGAALLALGAAPAAGLAAQVQAIRDNSFLVEEAYNQDAGVVQHAALLHHAGGSAGWQVVLAQEWPLGSQRHQLSFSMPFSGGAGASGPGDLGVHYRYQLRGGGAERLAIAPRLSLLAPTGSPEDGTGAGSVGLQVGLPASLVLGSRLAGHVNAAVTLTPASESPAGSRATALDLGAGASLVWLVAPWVNLLVEGIWARTEEVVGAGVTAGRDEAFLNPGLRFAWNLPGGQQLVPGIAWTIGVGPSAGAESRLLVYLSFEHSFRRRLTGAEAAAQLALHPSRQAR